MSERVGLALVTGAGRGYGAVVARHLAAAGATVACMGRDQDAMNAIAGEIDGVPLIADVVDTERVASEVERLVSDRGPVDVLVNNAGIGSTSGLAWEVPAEDWWRTVEVNLLGTHNVTSAVVPGMVDAGRGRIVNVVSHAGTARWPYNSSYVVSKAAVIKYGENLAAEVRRRGVVVLNFHPGILEIGLTEALFAADPQPGTLHGMMADWFRKQRAEGRMVDADVSAAKLVRLVRGEADALTGRYFTAYDDLDGIFARADEIAASKEYTLGLIQPD